VKRRDVLKNKKKDIPSSLKWEDHYNKERCDSQGLNGDDTVLYGPEIKWYSARAELTDKLEAPNIKNLFCGGDGCGISRGIVQAAMCGIIIGREIGERA
jgi:uncharacterized FAD-dependent dehydrogenase